MTTIINFITTNFTSSTPYSAISNGMAVISIVLLLAVLIELVLMDAYQKPQGVQRTHVFGIVLVPLFIIMAVVIFLRMAQILEI